MKALDGRQFLLSERVLETGNPTKVHRQSLEETVKEVSYFCGVTPCPSIFVRVSKFVEDTLQSDLTMVLLG